MSTTSITSRIPVRALNDYLSLAKARSVLPHLITAAAAMFTAARGLPPVGILVFTLVGGGIVAASANVFNSYLDRDIDASMSRTQNRPLPAGRLTPTEALAFGVIIGVLGIIILVQFVDWIAAALAAFALAYYIIPYTLWLKRRTYWSTIVGSGIGAIPPIIGWEAVTNRIGIMPFILSGIIILWTMPHFWSLAVFRRKEYKLAGIEIMPDKQIAFWTAVCSILLAICTVLPVLFGGLGIPYLVVALVLAATLLGMAARLVWRSGDLVIARQFYIFSIAYIVLLFCSIIIDRLVF